MLDNASVIKSEMNVKKRDFRTLTKKYGTSAVLVVLVAINALVTPNFTSVSTLWNILIQATEVMLVALGMTMVISSGGIDISVGSVMAVSSMVVAKYLGLGVIPAILMALAAAGIFGLFSGVMIAHFKIQPIIVTLTLMISGRGIAQVMNNGMLLNFTVPEFSYLGTHRFAGVIPIQVFIMVGAIAVVYFITKKMTFGRYVEAIGDNIKASRLAGINTFMTIVFVYVLSSLFAGMAGLLETARLSAADANAVGHLIELDAIASVAVGGTPLNGGRASVLGTVIGALIMQIITVSVNMNNVPYAYSLVIKSIIIIVALYVQREHSR